MTEAQIKHMVSRFLAWKLPANFNPDGGVVFSPVGNAGTPHEYRNEPSGTNLLDAVQAEAMIRYILEGLPTETAAQRPEGKERPQFAYTGPSPDEGLVGFVNILETDTGVRFTVRSEGVDSVMATYEVPNDAARSLLASAATGIGAE